MWAWVYFNLVQFFRGICYECAILIMSKDKLCSLCRAVIIIINHIQNITTVIKYTEHE